MACECDDATFETIAPLIELGLHHEQQHQELLLTDIKVVLDANPMRPKYLERESRPERREDRPLGWVGFDGGVIEIGHGGDGFAYDNEEPRHRRFLEPFEIGERLVTNKEFLEFVLDGGYERPEFWLDEGWSWLSGRRRIPEYWSRSEDGWHEFTLDGERTLYPATPVCHLSLFEADAYAKWAGARLPTEAEWEHASETAELTGNFVESGLLHPSPVSGPGLRQMFGDVWEWTRSAHEPYPGYTPAPGAVGEYNGKFMCGSFVLRGGSCATSGTHIRRTYRNFFAPDAVWQFSGLRLARDRR